MLTEIGRTVRPRKKIKIKMSESTITYPAPVIEAPTDDELLDQLQAAVMDTEVSFETSDGCSVEPDGVCQHGHPTWLRRAGLI